jgi:hypothetical protein
MYENVRLMRPQDHGVVRRHLIERARQIVYAAKCPTPKPVSELVSEARQPETARTFA